VEKLSQILKYDILPKKAKKRLLVFAHIVIGNIIPKHTILEKKIYFLVAKQFLCVILDGQSPSGRRCIIIFFMGGIR